MPCLIRRMEQFQFPLPILTRTARIANDSVHDAGRRGVNDAGRSTATRAGLLFVVGMGISQQLKMPLACGSRRGSWSNVLFATIQPKSGIYLNAGASRGCWPERLLLIARDPPDEQHIRPST